MPPPGVETSVDHAAEIDWLRANGEPQRDPVRWHFIEAMARRAAASEGALRTLLHARLGGLLADCRAALSAHGGGSCVEPVPAASIQQPLAALLQHIGTHAAPAHELRALQRLRRTWSRLAANQQVLRSQAQLPQNAGPLHSQRLVHRALTLMREQAPDYLEHFVAHADALLWLERAGGGELLTRKDVWAPTAADTSKPKTRRRR